MALAFQHSGCKVARIYSWQFRQKISFYQRWIISRGSCQFQDSLYHHFFVYSKGLIFFRFSFHFYKMPNTSSSQLQRHRQRLKCENKLPCIRELLIQKRRIRLESIMKLLKLCVVTKVVKRPFLEEVSLCFQGFLLQNQNVKLLFQLGVPSQLFTCAASQWELKMGILKQFWAELTSILPCISHTNRASFSMLCSPLWEMCAPIITTKYFSPVLQTECPFYEKMTCDDSIDVFPKWRPTCVLHWIVACQSSASRSQSGRDKVMTMSMPILCTFLLISGQAAFFARCRGWSRYLLFISAAEDLNAHDPIQSFRRL